MLERLSAEDARILALESGAVVGHTCKVMIADRVHEDALGALRRRAEAGAATEPRLRHRLVPTPLGLAPPAWVDDPAFDPAVQIRRGAETVLSRERFVELAGVLMAERLDRSRPLWQVDVVDLEDDRVGVIWRVHHALADGQASRAYGEALLWDAVPEPSLPTISAAAAEPVPGPATLAAAAAVERGRALAGGLAGAAAGLVSPSRWRQTARELRAAPDTLGRELERTDEDSPLDAPIGRRRRVALADFALADVVGAAHALEGVTVNDVVLALVAGAMRRWLERRGRKRADDAPGRMRVQVPVSMHRPGDAAANLDSFINVDLPVDEPDPVRRVLAISEETSDRKRHHDADELFALFTDLAHVSSRLYRRAYDAASDPHVFALSVSNVRGPAEPRYLAGGRIREFYSLAEIAPRHALRVSVWSFSGRLSFGLTADADALPDLDVFGEAVADSLDELLARV